MKFFLLIVAAILPCLLAANWCGLESCPADTEHVDCKMSSGAMGLECDSSAMMLNLAPAQTAILDRINTHRNTVAGGQLANKFAAVRMGTMRWHIPLANLARKNVKKCTYTHDECINTPELDFVGQNIARSVVPLSDTRTNIARILELIDFWFSEHTDATMADIRQFPQPDGTKKIANFAQLVRDYSTRVGCAALTYKDATNKGLLLTCNFDLANVVDWPVYVDGPAGKNCTTGRNPNYRYLCSTNEVYNVNTFWEDFE